MSDTPWRKPAPTPASERPAVRARRQRRRRIRLGLQLVVSAAAIWFVIHPAAFPTLPDVEPLAVADTSSREGRSTNGATADTTPTDSLRVDVTTRFDTTTDDSPFGMRHQRGTGPGSLTAPFSHLPAMRLLPGLPRLTPPGRLFRSIEERARAGERIAVSVTAYCLKGTTRRGNPVRDGIVAVDRKLFPLGREIELFFGRKSYGRFMADDTGGVIKGGRIDVWMADCTAARRFGRRRGYAQSVRRKP